MKPDYTKSLEGATSEPLYDELGAPVWMALEEERVLRTSGKIGYIRCQHCAKVFRIVLVSRKVMPEYWEYCDPPFHLKHDGKACIGNTMLSIPEWEWET